MNSSPVLSSMVCRERELCIRGVVIVSISFGINGDPIYFFRIFEVLAPYRNSLVSASKMFDQKFGTSSQSLKPLELIIHEAFINSEFDEYLN